MPAIEHERRVHVPPLKAVREARGMSLRETARRAELDPTFLGRVEKGQERLSLRSLERVARVLGLRELAKLLDPWTPGDDDE